jgi:hypothetical protein
MAKQYKVKDINNNGKIDGWEQGKYDAINNSATKMGYAMKMGSKQIDSISNFKTQDAMLMGQSPMMMNTVNSITEKPKIKYSDGSVEGDTRGIAAGKGSLNPLTVDTSGLSVPKAGPSKKLTKAAKKQQKLAKKRDAKIMQAKTERQLGNYELGKQRSSRAARIQKRIDRRAKRLSKK